MSARSNDRHICRKLGVVLAGVIAAALPLAARASTIGLYTDESGSSCSFSGNEPGVVTAYVVVRPGPDGFRAVRFSAPVPACFGGSWVEDIIPTELPFIGDSQTGISIASGTCQMQPLHVLTISYLRTGSTTPCCPYPVLPEPGFDNIEVISCASGETSYTSHDAHFNANETCACSSGQAPDMASHPGPADGETGVTVWTGLSWLGSDYDGDLANFDVYLGTTAYPPLLAAHVTDMSYQPESRLDPVAHYYWRVVTRDAHGNQTSSPTWEFTTRPVNSAPGAPVAVNPADGAVTERSFVLGWTSFDVDHDRLMYDVYLGSGDSPALVARGQYENGWYTHTLQPSTDYSWKIVVHDPAGNVTEGSVWHFTTKQGTGLLAPYDPSPANGAVVGTATTLAWKGNAPHYRVYMSTDDTMNHEVASSLTSPSFDPPGNLLADTHYQWYVVAYSSTGEETGPFWSFYTGTAPENMPTAPASLLGPSNDAALLTWSVANPNGQSLTYDVYLGRNENPSFVGNTTEPTFTTGTLVAGARYYWRVDTWDGTNRVAGSNWSFEVPAVGLDLAPNEPNPFNPQTTIPYNVPWSGVRVRLAIYDASGRLIRVLVDETQNAGRRSVVWRGDDHTGQLVASGVYFCVLQAGEERRTQKLVLLK